MIWVFQLLISQPNIHTPLEEKMFSVMVVLNEQDNSIPPISQFVMELSEMPVSDENQGLMPHPFVVMVFPEILFLNENHYSILSPQ